MRSCARAFGVAVLAAAAADRGRADATPAFVVTNELDILANVRGGRRTGFGAIDKLELQGNFDGSRHGLHGLTASIDVQNVRGTRFSERFAGDIQDLSNIEAINALRLYELWVRSETRGGGAAVKAGIIDLNTEFDVQETGALFLASAHGIGTDFAQSGENGPSIFPQPGLGLVAEVVPATGWALRVGAFDGVPGNPARPKRLSLKLSSREGALLVGAVERRFGDAGRFALGAWRYTARFDSIAGPTRRRGNDGAYAIVEGRLRGTAAGDHLAAWLRVGVADAGINPVAAYLGSGVVAAVAGHRFGLAVARARFGGPARRIAEPRLYRAETAIEVTASFAVLPWLAVQPDVHYVVDPGGDPRLRDAAVVGVRWTATFPGMANPSSP